MITVGVEYQGKVLALPMRFRNQGDELVYCTPDPDIVGNLDLIRHAASIKVELLYPMSSIKVKSPCCNRDGSMSCLGKGEQPKYSQSMLNGGP